MSAAGWTPQNLGGTIHYDPRDALRWWASTAQGDMVAVPVDLLLAVVQRRVCRSTVISRGDEDGPLTPRRLHCTKPEGHLHDHGNGYAEWSQDRAETDRPIS